MKRGTQLDDKANLLHMNEGSLQLECKIIRFTWWIHPNDQRQLTTQLWKQFRVAIFRSVWCLKKHFAVCLRFCSVSFFFHQVSFQLLVVTLWVAIDWLCYRARLIFVLTADIGNCEKITTEIERLFHKVHCNFNKPAYLMHTLCVHQVEKVWK